MAKMRTALLPSYGDPFILNLFLHYFKKNAINEVDTLLIHIGSNIDSKLIYNLIEHHKHPKISFTYTNRPTPHGQSLQALLPLIDGDVVLLEEDCYILKPNQLKNNFDLLGEYELIASSRMSCPEKTATEAKQKYGLNYEGFGDRGPAFWPNFLFTDSYQLNWINAATSFNLGPSELGDTFVMASLEFRELIQQRHGNQDKIKIIPQYHLTPDDHIYKTTKQSIFDGECGYIHVGSLSSGISNILLDDRDRSLKDRLEPNCPESDLHGHYHMTNKLELTKRALFFTLAYQQAVDDKLFIDTDAEYFYNLYDQAITKFQLTLGVTNRDINDMRKLYKELL